MPFIAAKKCPLALKLTQIISIIYLFLIFTIPAYAEPICKVIDGDTFHLCNGFKVRLDSIDTPEGKEAFYFEARRALADMLQTRNIQITDCRIDSTGKRHACKVHADGKDVQAELVRMGLAWDWPKYSLTRYALQEKEAKASKRGLWVNNQASAIHWGKRKRL